MRLVTFHPDVEAEITEAAQFYEASSPDLGVALTEEIRRSLEQIVKMPEAYQLVGKRVRRKSLWRFPYNLIYAVYPDRVRVLAFAHQKRRPFYWTKRLKDTVE